MGYPAAFLNRDNFALAFHRVVRGGNKDYKNFYRHLFPSFNLALEENLADLVNDIKIGRFQPSDPEVIYQPKKTGVLRPLALLTLRDLVLYQAILNVVAPAFQREQEKHAFKQSFAAMFAGKGSKFFYRSWKTCYQEYNAAITRIFKVGNTHVADFDLVSFYELIDHKLLRATLAARVKNDELLDLLFRCLETWTKESSGAHLGHGIPQGPEPSAFLAECFLFYFDSKRPPKGVHYLRYADDIKLMSKNRIDVRRALVRLDLLSKDRGLVPQAQKITLGEITSLDELLKTIPSQIAAQAEVDPTKGATQADLLKMFRGSMKKEKKRWLIEDITHFKFALYRLNPRRDVLRRISTLLVERPDCAWTLAAYLKKFPQDKEAADILLNALKQDPTYDAAAASYIEAMDVCEPKTGNTAHRRAIQTAKRRSAENSIRLRIPSLIFRGRRCGARDAVALIEKEANSTVRSVAIDRLFAREDTAPYKLHECRSLLEKEAEGTDPDLSRYAAALLLENWPWFVSGAWKPPKTVHDSVKLLMVGLGLRKKGPKKAGVLDHFFQEKMKIGAVISWKKALGKDRRDAERRCLRLQKYMVGDPTARILMLDTFNEALIQSLSGTHPRLHAAYRRAAGPNPHPDFGNWVNNGTFQAVLPRRHTWFKSVHDARVRADLAHAKAKKTGTPTRPISFKEAETLVRGAQSSWAEMIRVWKAIV